MEKENSFKRMVSQKVKIKDIIEGEFIKMEGWDPSYILTRNNKRVSRVNIIGTIISSEPENNMFSIDDGTGGINLRGFGEVSLPKEISIGDIAVVIGKVRKFGEEIYIAPEVIKKIENSAWLKLRKMELELEEKETPEMKADEKSSENEEYPEFQELEDEAEMDIVQRNEDDKIIDSDSEKRVNETSSEKICRIIKEIDSGKGAYIEDVKEKLNIANCEKLINTLIEEGEIFQIRPGMLKVLE